MAEKNWQEILALKEHYVAIGNTNHYMYGRRVDEYPWEHVYKLEYSTYRYLDANNTVCFLAEVDGLGFHWNLELIEGYGEERKLNVEGIVYALASLPDNLRAELASALLAVVIAAQQTLDEMLASLQRDFGTVGLLRQLAKENQ